MEALPLIRNKVLFSVHSSDDYTLRAHWAEAG
jgi:hypothetical protein